MPSTSAFESPPGAGQVWIFAYGSLMWRPGFAYDEAMPARLHGYHRALCIYSIVHRGTAERPGLVLGLDRGGSCRGWAFRISETQEAEILAYLDGRELVTDVYQRKRLLVTTAHGRVPAWCYVVRRDHVQYAGQLDEDRVLELVQHSAGRSGRCCDYVVSTVSHLEQMGIADGPLHALVRRLVIRTESPSPRSTARPRPPAAA